jgi:2-(1,2-epoxy-1,2-dihydrophenyl)acetyl-CoA isomerase
MLVSLMEYSTIILEKVDKVATITLNRPERFNAVNEQMCKELPEALKEVAQDDNIRVLVMTGAGRGFCAGADISWFRSMAKENKRTGKRFDITHALTEYRIALGNVPQPTIASINGTAVGGGITMTLGFDIRIAAEETKIVFPFVSTVGITPEFGSTYMLPRLIGIAKACELIFTGKTITGKEAKEIGLVNEAVPLANLQTATSELAKTIAAGAPLAARLTKKGLYRGLNANDVYSQLLWEEESLDTVFSTEDHEEAVKAFFEKRKPVFKGK